MKNLANSDPEAEAIVEFYRTASTGALVQRADEVCRSIHGNKVWLRGLVEFSNYCNMDCQYCGIRHSNANVERYRLSPEQIVDLTVQGYEAGLRTFVLQGGEDPWFTADRIAFILDQIKTKTQGMAAITLSLGIRPRGVFAQWKSAGADRYLMRFETSDPELHRRLRCGATLERRLEALEDLRDCGYEVGSGYLVGLPGETEETRIANALLCREKKFDMVGIGPFIPHPETPLADAPQQPLELALRATALVRLLLPLANMPATTAAGSLDKQGREKMMAAGANVLMPNITPEDVKKNYLLYPNKVCLDESGFECLNCLDIRTHLVRKNIDYARGDSLSWSPAP
jgi:biotin synthase